tara:strand:- start:31 stop:132 length:102 start_codon:yes stop_codon:yes gene_type:complete
VQVVALALLAVTVLLHPVLRVVQENPPQLQELR